MKRFIYLGLLFLVCLLSTSFKVGSNVAYITGKSESSKTVFYAEIWDLNDFALEKAYLCIEKDTLSFSNKDKVVVTVQESKRY
jgi:hypothetical protein